MIILDVIVGYFMPDLFGWLFLGFVVILESFILLRLIRNQNIKLKTVLFLVITANLLTTILGYIIGEMANIDYRHHLGHLINNIPIDYYRGEYMFGRGVFIFIASFVTTMIFETLILYLGLKKYDFRIKEIALKSLIINLSSYLIGLVIIVLYVVQLMNK